MNHSKSFLLSLGLAMSVSASSTGAQTASEAESMQALSVLLSDFDQAQRSLIKKAGSIKPGEKYVIQPDDSLHMIAMQSYGNTALNLDLVKKLIVEKNPNGFFRGNGKYLLVGETIVVPSINDIRDYVFSYSGSRKYPHTPKNEWIRYP